MAKEYEYGVVDVIGQSIGRDADFIREFRLKNSRTWQYIIEKYDAKSFGTIAALRRYKEECESILHNFGKLIATIEIDAEIDLRRDVYRRSKKFDELYHKALSSEDFLLSEKEIQTIATYSEELKNNFLTYLTTKKTKKKKRRNYV